tara:strand:- start:2027 stop:2254 length:228 start_codon:yes stop_codon:yes gene_type:complete
MATFGNINVAKNDITGKFIKSDPPTKLYSDNYDKIFTKKTPAEWAEFIDVKVEIKDENKVSYKQFLLDYDIEVDQ